MKKKIIILAPSGHRLANQLWNFMSIYAYCLEKGYACENPSFFRYEKFFNIIPAQSSIFKILSFLHSAPVKKIRGWSYILYQKYVMRIKKHQSKRVVSDKREPHVFYLPPSKTEDKEYREALSALENSLERNFYFDGWLFRNPVGIEKYRKEIKEYFAPKKEASEKIEAFFSPLRKNFKEIVGIHIRQGDYRTWEGGQFYFQPKEVRKILEDYLAHHRKNPEHVLFLMCSDESVDMSVFNGLKTKEGPGGMIEDLFALSKTDLIIGCDSTYGAFAAYYGNIPLAVFSRNDIDWSKIRLGEGFNHANTCTKLFA